MDHEEAPTKVAVEVSSHLNCPICKKLYRDPVINIRCGHTFCRKCSFTTTHCPVDNSHCDTSQLVSNRLVVGQIDDLYIYCRYGLVHGTDTWEIDPSGCKEKIQLGNRQEHEDICLFAIVKCDNAEQCGTFQRQELHRHSQHCGFTPCRYKHLGCEFRGSPGHVDSHVKSCGYQTSLEVTKTTNLEEINSKLEGEVKTLSQRVNDLELVRDDLTSQLGKCNSNIQILQQKYSDLHATVESLLNSRNRRSYGSQMALSESQPLSSRLTSPSAFLTSNGKWEMPFQFKCIGTLRGHMDVVWCTVAHKGRLFSSGADGQIKVWDLDQLYRGCVQTLTGHTGLVHCCVVVGGCLYTAGDDHSIRVWDTDNGSCMRTLENAHDNIICAMVSTEDYLLTSSFSMFKVWDLTTLTLKHTISGLHHWVRTFAVSYKKDKLYSGSHNAISVWDPRDNFASLGTIDHTYGSVHALVTTQLYIIAGTYNQNIQIFNAESHDHITNLCGHIGTVTCLLAAPSGRFLFSGSHDMNVQVWSLELMLPIQTLSRHKASVNALSLYGDLILSGSEDHEIKVFRYFQLQTGQCPV